MAEADQTYFLRSAKGQRHELLRKARKRGGKASKQGLSREQVPVLVARDRSGQTADFILEVVAPAKFIFHSNQSTTSLHQACTIFA